MLPQSLLQVIPKPLKLLIVLDVIYLNGLYIDPLFHNGVKGVRIYHDSEYFKEKTYFHRQNDIIEKWTKNLRLHAQFFDI